MLKLVSSLAAHRSREVVVVLRELLKAAEAGEIWAIAFIIKCGPGDNRSDFVGEYKRNSSAALQATLALERMLREDIVA